MFAKRPAAQPRQSVAAGTDVWPDGHAAHAVAALLSWSYWPAVQSVQPVEPALLYCPAAHEPQLLCPALAWNVPAAQSEQPVAPPPEPAMSRAVLHTRTSLICPWKNSLP